MGYPSDLLHQRANIVEMPKFGPKNREEKKPVTMIVPYVPCFSEKVKQAWRQACQNYTGDKLDVNIVFRPVCKIRQLLVNPYPKEPAGKGIYRATCKICEKSYIGETGLYLSSRSQRHKYDQNSAIKKHEHGHGNFEFEHIARSYETNQRKILEAIFIKEEKPEINENSGIQTFLFD